MLKRLVSERLTGITSMVVVPPSTNLARTVATRHRTVIVMRGDLILAMLSSFPIRSRVSLSRRTVTLSGSTLVTSSSMC